VSGDLINSSSIRFNRILCQTIIAFLRNMSTSWVFYQCYEEVFRVFSKWMNVNDSIHCSYTNMAQIPLTLCVICNWNCISMVNVPSIEITLVLENTTRSIYEGCPSNITLTIHSTYRLLHCIKDIYTADIFNDNTVTPIVKWIHSGNSHWWLQSVPFSLGTSKFNSFLTVVCSQDSNNGKVCVYVMLSWVLVLVSLVLSSSLIYQ
jgi:hypothetical protein